MCAGVSVMNGLVYAVGGFNGSLRVRTVDVYDPIKDMWSSVASMEARRSTLGAAILNGMIYAVGGFDGSSGMIYIIQRFRIFRADEKEIELYNFGVLRKYTPRRTSTVSGLM